MLAAVLQVLDKLNWYLCFSQGPHAIISICNLKKFESEVRQMSIMFYYWIDSALLVNYVHSICACFISHCKTMQNEVLFLLFYVLSLLKWKYLNNSFAGNSINVVLYLFLCSYCFQWLKSDTVPSPLLRNVN